MISAIKKSAVLSDIIIQKIKRNGPVSFHDFMEMSLYYPNLGYYTSFGEKIGTEGDYCTSPDYTHLFGEMIGRQIEEMWKYLDEREFSIVEYGAGTGSLCRDILNYFKNNTSLFPFLNYRIIEKSPAMRQKAQSQLPDKVSWHYSLKELNEINGCVLSNELLDNFSVHMVQMEDQLMEVFVDYEGTFFEVLKPASQELKDYLHEQGIDLPKGYRTEINLEATSWIGDIATHLNKGYVMTIDYGFTADELYHPERSSGTLVCYSKHQTNENPYTNIGEQDITSHVNFSALNHWGSKHGLRCCGYTNQAYFLRGLGLVNYIRNLEIKKKEDFEDYNSNIQMIHNMLMSMGNKFKVLIQQKGIVEKDLSGLQFARHFI